MAWLIIIAVVWALFIMSAGAPQRSDPTVTGTPHVILIAARGGPNSATGEGITAFLWVITPGARSVGIVPVPGNLRMPKGGTLASVGSTAPAREIFTRVESWSHTKLYGYLVVDADTVQQALLDLWQNAPTWPSALPPSIALQDLGWPDSTSNPTVQLQLLQEIIQDIPELGDSQTALAGEMLQGARTNLSAYQMFILATYLRDQHLVLLPRKKLPTTVQEGR